MNEPPLRVMSLHALTYCERLFYLEEVEEIRVADEAVHDGRRLHQALAEDDLTSYVLEAPQLGLRGKVDAARRRDGALIPIEVKKGRAAQGPAAWPSDRVQVGAYAMLLEETQGVSIAEGRVRYLESGRTVQVPIDESLRRQVSYAIERARALRRETTRPPVTENARLCPRCSLAPVCLPEEERLAQDEARRPVRLFPPHTDRTIVHALEHGAHVGRTGDRLTVRLPATDEAAETEASFPIHQVESVVVHGNAQISTQALRLCAEHEISVQWVTSSGLVFGAMHAASQGAQRHLRQFRALSDEAERLRLSRLLVSAKVDAQYQYLQRVLRGDERGEARELLARVRRGTQQVGAAHGKDELLGIEGATAAAYFEGLGLSLRPDLDPRLRYVRRSRRPAADRFSALLNYLYGMLYRQVLASILAVGLHPGVGFCHQPRSAAPPLVLDLMELFRVPMVDMPLIGALNRQTFRADSDFEEAGHYVGLSAEGKAKAIEIFERRKLEEWRHSVVGYSLSYARMVELEVRLLEKELGGEGQLFARFRLR